MNIIAAIIDHNQASIDERELFACSAVQADMLYEQADNHPDIAGAVLLNTCNRTELYLSLRCAGEGIERADVSFESAEQKHEQETKSNRIGYAQETVGCPDPYVMLCECMNLDPSAGEHLVRRIRQDDVLLHLCLLTSGALSQLVGDSQIITQVTDALADAQKREATDAVLNTVFRLGITAGKKVRTNKNLRLQDESTVDRAIKTIENHGDIRRVLVIGNGMIGRLAAGKLAQRGYVTEMTLRQYHNREAIIPGGVHVVPYTDRYAAMEECDAVISATASPHVVVTEEAFSQVENPPRLLLDLAVPRDIDMAVAQMAGITCLNIDEISQGREQARYQRQLELLKDYVGEYIDELHRWEEERLRIYEDVKRLTAPDRDRTERRYFPLFIDSFDRQAVVIGGGNIAERRVLTLAEFGFLIRVVSNSLTDTLKRMEAGGAITWVQSYVRFRSDNDSVPGTCAMQGHIENATGISDIQKTAGTGNVQETVENTPGTCSIQKVTEDAWMVIACTNDRAVNHQIGEYCREHSILVNVSDARRESTFWFPAVGLNDELTMGLVGTGTDHKNVKHAAAALRSVIRNKEYK